MVLVINPRFGAIVVQKMLNVLELDDLASKQFLVGLVIFIFLTGSMCRHNFGYVFLLFGAVDEKRLVIEGNC